MNRTYIFTDETPEYMGRFGRLQSGDEIQLRLDEEECLKTDPRFQKKGVDEELVMVELKATNRYDLRRVEWDSNRLASHLRQKGGASVRSIAEAMKEIGSPIDLSEQFHAEDCIDLVIRYAVGYGWNLMDRDTRLACPGVDDVPPDELDNTLPPEGEGEAGDDDGEEDDTGEETAIEGEAPAKAGPKRRRKKATPKS